MNWTLPRLTPQLGADGKPLPPEKKPGWLESAMGAFGVPVAELQSAAAEIIKFAHSPEMQADVRQAIQSFRRLGEFADTLEARFDSIERSLAILLERDAGTAARHFDPRRPVVIAVDDAGKLTDAGSGATDGGDSA